MPETETWSTARARCVDDSEEYVKSKEIFVCTNRSGRGRHGRHRSPEWGTRGGRARGRGFSGRSRAS